MPKTGAVKHTHQYYRHSNGLWHCSGIEGCTHYRPKNMPDPAGQNSICWRCENSFQLTPVNMENDRPTCDACSDRLAMIQEKLKMDGLLDDAPRKTGLAAFGAKPVIKPQPLFNPSIVVKVKKEEVDRPTSEEHAPDCDIYMGGDCSCNWNA